MMLYGEHLHANEEPGHCMACRRRAVVEVFDRLQRSRGVFCRRHGRAAYKALQRQEDFIDHITT